MLTLMSWMILAVSVVGRVGKWCNYVGDILYSKQMADVIQQWMQG